MPAFLHDNTLPALPIPDLTATCDMVKRLAFPFCSTTEFNQVCAEADRLKTDGQALQQALLEWRESLGRNASWLRPWWDDSYLTIRTRMPMEVNYAFELIPERWGDAPLASLMLGTCRFFQHLAVDALAPEETRAGPLAMDALRSMAYTRIPAPAADSLQPVRLAGPVTAAVVCKGAWFILSLADASGTLADADSLADALEHIRAVAAESPAAPPLGAMTAASRENAASIRAALFAQPINRLGVVAIENCLFTVSLDDASDSDFFHSVVAGPAGNRWFDKSLQIICRDNAHIGVNLEHSGCDAGLWVYALNWIDANIRGNPPVRSSAAPVPVRRLQWNMPPAAQTLLEEAQFFHSSKANTMHMAASIIDTVDREKSKQAGCAPDAFSQLAFQCAYYRATGSVAPAYEAVSVRNFYQGRTECARPASDEAIAFAKALAGGTEKDELQRLYRAAEKAHKERLGQCQKGQGAERHLYGLRCMAEMLGCEEPGIFSTPGWKKATTDILSTSSVSADCIRQFGFGPVVENGLGIGYAMAKDGLHAAVTSLPGSAVKTDRYMEALRETIAMMTSSLF